MKKTHSINISGYGFVIDEDAYDMLYNYLSTLDQICRRAGESETATDIEQRMAELFAEILSASGRTILTIHDVEDVIGRIGRPEEIVEIEDVKVAEDPRSKYSRPTDPNPQPATPTVKKRLYRDLSNRVFGGVCSGLGWYLGIDPTWIRIIMVVLALLTGTTVAWIYIILWIIVPGARTPYQQMQMMGVDPSVSNVGKVVTGEYHGSWAGNAVSGIAKGILSFFLIIALLVVGAMILSFAVAIVGCLVAVCIIPGTYLGPDMLHVEFILGCVIGGALIVGIPMFFVFRSLFSSIQGRELPPLSLPWKIALGIFWVLGLASAITCGILL